MPDEEITKVKVTRPMVLDVTGIADHGMRAAALFAGSMGWNVRQPKPGGQVTITARDGTVLSLPSNTSVRRSFMASQIRQIMTHTEAHKEPTLELIEQIIRMVKLNRENERELREATGVGYPPKKKLPEPSPIPSFRNDAPKNGAPKTIVPPPPEMVEPLVRPQVKPEAITPPKPEPLVPKVPVPAPPTPPPGYVHKPVDNEPPTIIKREPFVGKFSRTNTSPTSNIVTFSDGTVKYECVICGELFKDPRGIGGHRISHIRAGEATQATWVSQRHAAGREATAALQQIAKLVAPYIDSMVSEEEVESLRIMVRGLTTKLEERDAELAEVTADRDQLRANLKALRELLGGVE